MNIAVCQLNFTVGDISANKDKIIEQIEIQKAKGVDLVLFPELALSGTPLYDIVALPDFPEKCYSALSEIADATKDIAALVGLPTTAEEDVFNSVAYLKNGEVVEIFSKAMISSREEVGFLAGVDSPFFAEGESDDSDSLPCNTIELAGQTALVVIGEDLNFINDVESKIKFDLIIQIAARSYHHGVIEEDLEFLGSIASECGVPLVTCNAVGASTDIIHYGASALFSPEGNRLLKMPNFEPSVAIAATSHKSITAYSTIKISPSSPSSRMRHDYKAIALGLKDYFNNLGFQSACLGLSGGIDSAVVLAIAADVLGAENVRVLMMPSQFSSDHSVTDSIQLAKNLGVRCEKIEIEPIYNAFMESFTPILGQDTSFSVAQENLQSRIRGVLMMFLSNKYGNLVLNTTNKSEAAMGYGTLYGDTNGGLSILGDLYKTEVYALAQYINRNGEVIPRSILDKAPSAELRPNQKDSDTLPEYDVLDKILYALLEENMSVLEVVSEGYDIDEVTEILRKIQQNEHKRYQLAPSLRVSKCVLGKDRIIPIVSKL